MSQFQVPFPRPMKEFGMHSKLEFRAFYDEASDDPIKVETSFASDRCLVDFLAIDPSALDTEKLIRDCEILGEVARTEPDRLRELIASQREREGFSNAFAIARELGVTEAQVAERGGGLMWLLVVAVILAAGSCEHCHASHESH